LSLNCLSSCESAESRPSDCFANIFDNAVLKNLGLNLGCVPEQVTPSVTACMETHFRDCALPTTEHDFSLYPCLAMSGGFAKPDLSHSDSSRAWGRVFCHVLCKHLPAVSSQ